MFGGLDPGSGESLLSVLQTVPWLNFDHWFPYVRDSVGIYALKRRQRELAP